MTLAFDIPSCKPSPLQRFDPRWKLAGVLLATLAITLLRTWAPALVALAVALVLVALARLPWRWYLGRLGLAMSLFVLFMVWLPFVVQPDDVTWDIGAVTLSQTGTLRLVTLTAKLGGMISLMLVLLATAPLHDTFKAAQSLRIPRVLIHLVTLTYRYVFLLVDEFARLRIALRVRGFRNQVNAHSYRTIGQVAGTLLVRSHERSDRVAQAMRCRGFDGEYRSLHEFTTSTWDVLAFLGFTAYAVGLLVWDWLAR
jgi:cobalt/nickel transport system permease protein